MRVRMWKTRLTRYELTGSCPTSAARGWPTAYGVSVPAPTTRHMRGNSSSVRPISRSVGHAGRREFGSDCVLASTLVPHKAHLPRDRVASSLPAEGRNIEGSNRTPLTIASAPVDLVELADVCFSERDQDPPFGILSCGFTA